MQKASLYKSECETKSAKSRYVLSKILFQPRQQLKLSLW